MKIETNESRKEKNNLDSKKSEVDNLNENATLTNPKEFTITPEQTKPVEITVNDTAITGTVNITVNDQNNKPVVGAQIQVIDSTGNVVQTVTTNSLGEANITNLPYGNYTLKESKVPEGYILASTNPITISIKANNQVLPENIINTVITGSLQVTKTDEEKTKPIQGATFQIRQSSNSSVVSTQTTNASGQFTVLDLPYGSYNLVEMAVPEGYVLNSNPIPFSIKTNNEVVTQDITNKEKTGELIIKKEDATTSELLEGAVFTITNSAGKSFGTVTTGSDGQGNINLLPGDYIATETTPPSGYVSNTTEQNFTIPFNPQAPVMLTFKDTKQLCKVTITKVDASNTSKVLQGATFTIKTQEGVIVQTLTTGLDGTATTSLSAGTYTLEEIEAPVGYVTM
ncbi:SpaA isopeptide-forming pilin-related protein [Clostridium septicum]|uniref:SpaA isopeptide-forming pilin-related protein n=1 Tax=Clostridium septicum TaxID=1504 RepID=A0A9N7JMR8_CLOSE|nr:SpaA isopeptide-forming pilin-related protein [Clostridium septicum]AYE34865.1 hypothetical protein CP523_10860 [Clostridium septicum]MDU1314701.1 SpaA isopeptide-forming pilin-related protein [Clostridium septicum]QAS60260.1 hypothetical protein EI377_05655 [Clostridium septicum]UEC20485.1 carboxypeptidase regulatory-like domain-containing protein [Clostridium septicum]USS01459.1 SpaA isopeptide-forming pilin-related protein [Clostridium septicum]